MSIWADRSARALWKLSAMVSVSSSQGVQLCALLCTGGSVTKSLGCVLGHECLTVLCLCLIAGQGKVPGYLHLYDAVVVNFLVQLLNTLLSYSALVLAAVVAGLLYYSVALQHVEQLDPQHPPAIRRKYCKHKR